MFLILVAMFCVKMTAFNDFLYNSLYKSIASLEDIIIISDYILFVFQVAWVTKSGQSDLETHLALRLSSETIMYPYYSKWIRGHRDLPLKLNQWCNAVRWVVEDPTPFIRHFFVTMFSFLYVKQCAGHQNIITISSFNHEA